MTQNGTHTGDLNTLVDHIEPVFDEVVAAGTDDELFASGYLRGHFDLDQLDTSGAAL